MPDQIRSPLLDASPDHLIRRGLKFSHLRLIAALEFTGQISAAAAQVSITQPAASRLLAELEAIFDTSLYRRRPHGVTLTENGLTLAKRAHAILRSLDATYHEVSERTAGNEGTVHLGAVTGPALEIVLPTIRHLRITRPGIDVSVVVDTSDRLAEALLAGRLDFYLGRVPPSLDPRPFRLRVIGTEPARLIARREHPVAANPKAGLLACLDYDWVMQPPGSLLRHTVETYLLERGLPLPARVFSTSSLLMTLALIAQTNAIAPIARSVAEFYADPAHAPGDVVILPFADDLAVAPYSLIRAHNGDLAPAAAAVYTMIEERI